MLWCHRLPLYMRPDWHGCRQTYVLPLDTNGVLHCAQQMQHLCGSRVSPRGTLHEQQSQVKRVRMQTSPQVTVQSISETPAPTFLNGQGSTQAETGPLSMYKVQRPCPAVSLVSPHAWRAVSLHPTCSAGQCRVMSCRIVQCSLHACLDIFLHEEQSRYMHGEQSFCMHGEQCCFPVCSAVQLPASMASVQRNGVRLPSTLRLGNCPILQSQIYH